MGPALACGDTHRQVRLADHISLNDKKMKTAYKGMISGLVIHIAFFSMYLLAGQKHPGDEGLVYVSILWIVYFPLSLLLGCLGQIINSVAFSDGAFAILGGGYYMLIGYWVGRRVSLWRRQQ